MQIYIYIYTYIHTHIYIREHIYTYIHICICPSLLLALFRVFAYIARSECTLDTVKKDGTFIKLDLDELRTVCIPPLPPPPSSSHFLILLPILFVGQKSFTLATVVGTPELLNT